jgi:cell division protein FtsL
MNIKKTEIKKFITIWLPLLIIVLGMFLSDGPLFIFFSLALWFWFSIMIINVFIWIFGIINQRVIKPIDERLSNTKLSSKFQISEKNHKRIEKFNRYFLPIVIGVVLSLNVLTLHMAIITHWKSEQNIPKFNDLIDTIVEEKDSNLSKTKAILNWFDDKAGNIYNNWRLRKSYIMAIDSGRIQFYSVYPYIGVRTYNDEDALWILTSQFGHCGEYSNLYRAMADYGGLRVRKVCTEGENHCWNEVFINDTIGWIIVDSTAVFLDEEKNGYDNVNRSFMKSRLGGNLSRVEAQEKGGSYFNVTNDYTNEVNITVLTVDSNNEIVPSVTVKLFSNNRYEKGRYTNIKGVTEKNGKYTFTIGMGHYTIKASKDNLFGVNSSIYSDEKLDYNITIFMEEK